MVTKEEWDELDRKIMSWEEWRKKKADAEKRKLAEQDGENENAS